MSWRRTRERPSRLFLPSFPEPDTRSGREFPWRTVSHHLPIWARRTLTHYTAGCCARTRTNPGLRSRLPMTCGATGTRQKPCATACRSEFMPEGYGVRCHAGVKSGCLLASQDSRQRGGRAYSLNSSLVIRAAPRLTGGESSGRKFHTELDKTAKWLHNCYTGCNTRTATRSFGLPERGCT